VIDEDRRFFEAFEGALRAGRHGAQIVVVSDAGKDKLLALGGLAGGRRAAAAKFLEERDFRHGLLSARFPLGNAASNRS